MFVEMLRGFNQHPAGVTTSLFGDAAVITVFAGLISGRDQSEIGGRFIGIGEAVDIAEGGKQGLGDGEVDAGQGHEQADARIGMSLCGKGGSDVFDQAFDNGAIQ